METLRLTAALQDCDHMRDFTSGAVQAQGLTIIPLSMRPYEMFYRFMKHQEFDVSELSFGYYCSLVANGDTRAIGIPVFPSRVFRQSSIYVCADGAVKTPKDLAGKRIGIAEWGMTATIYIRGWINEQMGVDLASIDWIQGGVNEPGRAEKVLPVLPNGIRLRVENLRSLSEMLIAGELDAIFCAAPPEIFKKGDKRIARLIREPRTVEQAYFKETGIYPIMHVVAIRGDVYKRDRWVARSIFDALEEAKNRSVSRITSFGSLIPLPWCYDDARRVGAEMFPDGDYWPYGLEPNRRTIESFLSYAYAQGVCSRPVTPEELFAPETLSSAIE